MAASNQRVKEGYGDALLVISGHEGIDFALLLDTNSPHHFRQPLKDSVFRQNNYLLTESEVVTGKS